LEYLAEYYGNEEGYDIKFEDLGLVKRNDVDKALYLALENTHRHQLSLVTQTDQGYHVAKILDRRYQQPLEMVRSEIMARLIERHRRQGWTAIRDELFRQHNVRFPGVLPPFELPRLSDRNHPRTLPKAVNVIQ
jgi:hypothetical protein